MLKVDIHLVFNYNKSLLVLISVKGKTHLFSSVPIYPREVRKKVKSTVYCRDDLKKFRCFLGHLIRSCISAADCTIFVICPSNLSRDAALSSNCTAYTANGAPSLKFSFYLPLSTDYEQIVPEKHNCIPDWPCFLHTDGCDFFGNIRIRR